MENEKRDVNKSNRACIRDFQEKLDRMNEFDFDESVLDAYLDALGEEAEPDKPLNAQASFTAFREKHAVLFETLEQKPKAVSSRRRRWGYRLVVAAALLILLNSMCAVAFGRGIYDYVVMWGEETFGVFGQPSFETSPNGKIIYYPDGTTEDRSGRPDYDHATYTTYAQTSEEESESELIAEQIETAKRLSLPEQTIPEFANLPDTDVAALGLKKENSYWSSGHTVENIIFCEHTPREVAAALGVTEQVYPTYIPKEFSPVEVQVKKDYATDSLIILGTYVHSDGVHLFSTDVYDLNSRRGKSEKDDRPVKKYSSNGVDWYIFHNLEDVVAVAIVGEWEVEFTGPVTEDEMKKIIDSVYKE